MEEIYSLDEASLEDLRFLLPIISCFLFPFINFIPYCSFNIVRPVHGLIFLFKWKPGEEPAGPIVHESRSLGMFFAKQVRLCVNPGLLQISWWCNIIMILVVMRKKGIRSTSN